MTLFPLQVDPGHLTLIVITVFALSLLAIWLSRARLKNQFHALQTAQQVAAAQFNNSCQRETQQAAEIQQLRAELVNKAQELARNQVIIEKGETALNEQHRQLEQARTTMTQQFENLANRIFEEKQQKFMHDSEASIRKSLDPLERQLGDFRKRVEHVYDRDNAERNSLIGQIKALREQTHRISEEAVNLTSALKGDNKLQGNWGEVVLERLLEQSGLQKGREYETQVSLSSAGRRRQPDVIVRLPDQKDLIIDAKLSLLDYERYCSATTDSERSQALKQHVQSLRAHINGLSKKAYEQLEGVRTLDFVFIFIPIETAYMLAMQEDPSLFRDAYDKHIVLVSPSSLMATLRTVENIWRYEKQNSNAEKIAQEAGKLHDQFALMLESLDEIGNRIDQANQAFQQTRKRLVTSPGNVVKRIDTLRKLGAKTRRKLNPELRRQAEAASEQEVQPSIREPAPSKIVVSELAEK